jgi:hypothetical protein
MMNEEEVNAWYEEQKQMIFETYLKSVEDNEAGQKDRLKGEEKFKKEMQKVRRRYEAMFMKSLTPTKAKEYSKKIRKFMDSLIKIYK